MPKYKVSNADGRIVEYIEAARFIFQGGTFLFMDENEKNVGAAYPAPGLTIKIEDEPEQSRSYGP